MWKALISSFGILTIITSGNKKTSHHEKSELASDIDLSSILHADFTCCHDKTDGAACINEGAYTCIWVDDTSSQFAQDLAAKDGHSCFGEEYIRCKETANDLDACCSPGCVGPAPVGPPVATPPPAATPPPDICFQKTPTEEPTPQPIEPPCTMNVDYSFEGVACQISGDPHTKLTNGDKHDFQGQPLYDDGNGNILNQFYYVTTCDGSDTDDMPYRISATHYNWGDRDVSGVDYLTIELYDDNGNVYYVYLNHAIHSYAMAGNAAVSTNYDDTPSGNMMSFTQNTPLIIGNIFTLTYTQTDSNRVSLEIEIETPHGVAEVFIYMAGQMNVVGRSKRMHYVYLRQDSLFKCHACGLCGNYKDLSTGQSVKNLEACDGSYVQYRAGWNADNTPEAYDVWGWTYEVNFYNNECGTTTYDITDNTRGLNYVDPCDPDIADDIVTKCAAEVAANSDCCDVTIGGTVCEDLQADCEFDACVIATDNGGTEAAMNNAVDQVLGTPIEEACAIPDVGNEQDLGNLDNYDYVGCYKDDSTRAMEHTASMDIADHNTAKCVDLCLEWRRNQGSKARLYMGLQYNKECFCSLSLDSTTMYGLQTKKERCGEYQDVAVRDQKGCWGGRWTNCVYEIDTPGNAQKIFMNEIHVQDNVDNINLNVDGVHYINNKPAFIENQYIQMGLIGAVIVLVGGVWYIKRNKDDKYMPIDDSNSLNNNV